MTAAGGTITLLLGTVLLRLTLTGTYQRYVRVGMGPLLLVSGVLLVGLGMVSLVRAFRARPDGVGSSGQHLAGHGHDERVGWLLLAPIAALLLVAPPALGSYGVDRGTAVDVRAGPSSFEPLDSDTGPVPLTLLELSQRALDHDGRSLAGVTVQLTGFVADHGAVFRLARYQIACCAIDAAPIVVRVAGTTGDRPAVDQWVTATGTLRPGDGDDEVPELAATSIVEVPPPDDPYE